MENEGTGLPVAGNTEPTTDEAILSAGGTGGSATPEPAGNQQVGGGDGAILNAGEPKNEDIGAPETYADFTLPEGFTLDADGKAQAAELFKGLNLSQKGGQKLMDAYIKQAKAQKEAELNALNERRKAWRSEIRQRPSFQSDRLLAQKGLNAVVTDPAEVALFKDSWMSDHPALFNVFVKVGRLLGEDTPLPSGSNAPVEDSAVKRFPLNLK